MKIRIVIVLLTMGWQVSKAGVSVETFDGINQLVPEGNPVGLTINETVGDIPAGSQVLNITLSLTMSGGFNGDLYGYIVAPNGSMVTLLNYPGVTGDNPFGYGGSGFNITLSDAASSSIQTAPESAGTVLTGTYQAAGALAGLDGSPANGDWTVFFYDNSVGGGESTLDDFSMEITSTPEPANVALALFAVVVISTAAVRWRLRTGKAAAAGS